MHYLSQRYTMPCKEADGLLTDVGTGRLTHLEMIYAIIYRLTKNLTSERAKTTGFDAYYIDHTTALQPTAATSVPLDACEFQSKDDVITDLHGGLAAEQKARATYDNLIRITENPEVGEPLKFLRVREVVHFQRFREALEEIEPELDEKDFHYLSPEPDRQFTQSEK